MPSRLQLDVLKLYRELLRWTTKKPQPNRSNIRGMIRRQFELHRDLPRNNINHIEHLLRRGKNKLIIWKDANIDDIKTF